MFQSNEDFVKSQNEILPEVQPQDLSGKVIIVTGSNVGIGYETAKALASMKPKTLILACRNPQKAVDAVISITEATGCENIEAWDLDLASFASVKDFAAKFITTGLPLHVLVNNAAISAMEWAETKDSYEISLQVNHLSTLLLTLLLTPALRATPSSRVVVVSSETHFWQKELTADDATPIQSLFAPETFQQYQRYFTTKLLNVLFAQEYARRCPHDIWICSANPGYTVSELGKKDATTGLGGDMTPRAHNGYMPRPTSEGAKTIIFCAIQPDLPETGRYYSNMREKQSSTLAADKELARRVWTESIDIVKESVDPKVLEDWMTA